MKYKIHSDQGYIAVSWRWGKWSLVVLKSV